MSLIYFHMFLISTGVIFSFGFGLWELGHFSNAHKHIDLITGIVSFAFAFLLLCYLIWFVKKKKPTMNS